MTINDRVDIFEFLFDNLMNTTSRIQKEAYIKEFEDNYPELKEDLTMILETLDGKYPIGWTFQASNTKNIKFVDIASIIRYLFSFKDYNDLTFDNRYIAEREVGEIGAFIEPIINRALRLGIGKSLLIKTDITPMLAKKYEGGFLHNDVFVTEKLDGNRCMASYDGFGWNFTSRNGKKMNVNFDMSGLPKEFIYDGEVMSIEQTELSRKRNNGVMLKIKQPSALFNKTSGLISRHGEKKDLIYTIFDIISNVSYEERRQYLNNVIKPETEDIRILPILYHGTDMNIINSLLDIITVNGGEGIMLNVHNRGYEHKRSDALLKYKKTQFIDMLVVDIYEGKGKYENMCGGLIGYMRTDDGKEIGCEIGTGLSDQQRWDWGKDKSQIVGKIIEVGYHEMSQDRFTFGTNLYSLRFPRLIRIRDDKKDTSQY